MAVSNLFHFQWLETADHAIGSAAVAIRNDFLTPVFRFFTLFGGTKFSVFFLAVVCLSLFFFKRKDLAIWYGITAAFGAGILNQAVKYTFKKPRPEFEHLVSQGGYTFPSGHSMGSMIIYGGLLFLIFQLNKNLEKKQLLVLTGGMAVFILLIGLSRIYLGVHFASDIIGGYSLGASALFAFIGIYLSKTAG